MIRMIRVWNLIEDKDRLPPAKQQTYIGRAAPRHCRKGSPLGNPFQIGKPDPQAPKRWLLTRPRVIERFAEYLTAELATGTGPVVTAFNELRARHQRGADIHLVCYCRPLACHGDVLKAKLEELA